MKKNKYIILDNEGEHEFDLVVKEKIDKTIYILKASNSNVWTSEFSGKKIFKATDDGNGIKLKSYQFKFKNMSTEYHHMYYLHIILDMISRLDNTLFGELKIYEGNYINNE